MLQHLMKLKNYCVIRVAREKHGGSCKSINYRLELDEDKYNFP